MITIDVALLAVIVASLALSVSTFMAWRSCSSRRDYARSVIISKRIEAAVEYMSAFDKGQKSLATVLAAINWGDKAGRDPREHLKGIADQFSEAGNALVAACSTVSVLFDQRTAQVATEIYLEMAALFERAYEAMNEAGEDREVFKSTLTRKTAELKVKWQYAVRPAIVSTTDSFFARSQTSVES